MLQQDECVDYGGGAVVKDKYNDTCADYTNNPQWCSPGLTGDNDDFTAATMCCACQDDQTSDVYAGCTDSNSNVDKDGFGCDYYVWATDECLAKYASADMNPVTDCCGCGGGIQS